MEFVLIGVGILSVVILPIIAFTCAKGCDGSKVLESEPELQNFRKGSSEMSETESNEQIKVCKFDGNVENGSVMGATYEDISDPTYAEPAAVKVVSEDCNGKVDHDTTPVSRNSTQSTDESRVQVSNQTRHSSQDRALPDIPGVGSTSRALPDPPEADDLYDHLEREVPSHTVKPKSATLKRVEPTFVFSASNSVDQSNLVEGASSNAIYDSVLGESTEQLAAEQLAAEESNKSQAPVRKGKGQYSKIKRSPDHMANAEARISATPDEATAPEEPVYAPPPPVPEKMFGDEGIDASVSAANAEEDENPQDSASGYCTVNDAVAVPLNPQPHASIPENYDLLTQRTSINRMPAQDLNVAADDYYEYVEQDQGENAAADFETYAEIDSQPPAVKFDKKDSRSSTRVASGGETELYAEIDFQEKEADEPQNHGNLHVPVHADPGYEKVTFDNHSNAPLSNKVSNERMVATDSKKVEEDDDDYAECGNGEEAVPLPCPNLSSIEPEPAQGSTTTSVEKPLQHYTKQREHLYQEIDEVRSTNKENLDDDPV